VSETSNNIKLKFGMNHIICNHIIFWYSIAHHRNRQLQNHKGGCAVRHCRASGIGTAVSVEDRSTIARILHQSLRKRHGLYMLHIVIP
jgi:hypothetical protein